MRRRPAALVACLLLLTWTAHAHRIDEYLQATLLSLESNRVHASTRLIPGILVAPSVIAGIDTNGDGVFSDAEQHAYAQRVLSDVALTLDGHTLQTKLEGWNVPQPALLKNGLGEIHIEWTADLPTGGFDRALVLTNHHLVQSSVYLVNAEVPEDHNLSILAQKRNAQQTVYELDYEQQSAGGITHWSALRAQLDSVQLSSLFHLGMRHIAEGTDHLLFLLTLLLPAPLLVIAGRTRRWGPPAPVRQSLFRILSIVTAFTLGHSITLTLAAFGALHVPSRPIEVLIAVSIFVSALHALRPIVPGKEALIAGSFGLIHGLAFAATLDRLGLGRWERLDGIFAFNLGIEAMQMLVVALMLPSLMLMSRTRAYPLLRIGGAVFAGVASLGWMVERTLNIQTPVDKIVNALAQHALVLAIALCLLSLACRFLLAPRAAQLSQTA